MVSTVLDRSNAVLVDRAWSLRQLASYVRDCTQRELLVSAATRPDNPVLYLPYHTPNRLVRLADDTVQAMTLLRQWAPESVKPTDIAMARMAAYFSRHLVAYAVSNEQIVLQDRRPWANDIVERNARAAAAWLRTKQMSQREIAPTDNEIAMVAEMILATEVNGQMRHTNLDQNSSIAARILAAVEAGQAGLHSFLRWKEEIIRQWHEEDIASLVLRLRGQASGEERDQMRQRILDHLTGAWEAAAYWQEAQLDQELIFWLPEEARQPMRDHFRCHLSEVVNFGQLWQQQCRDMSAPQLLEEFALRQR